MDIARDLVDLLLKAPNDNENISWVKAMIDMCRSNYAEDAAKLMDLKANEPENPLHENLFLLAGSGHYGLIHTILNASSEEHPKLFAAIAQLKMTSGEQFPPFLKNLLVLIAQGNEEFETELEEAFFNDEESRQSNAEPFKPLIAGGNLELAHFLWERQGSEPFDSILKIPSSSIQGQLVSISRSASANPNHTVLLEAALSISQEKRADEEVEKKLSLLSLLYAQNDPGLLKVLEQKSKDRIFLYLEGVSGKKTLDQAFKSQLESHRSLPETELSPKGAVITENIYDNDAAQAIATCLLNKDGSINFGLIKDMQESKRFEGIPLSAHTKQHMNHVMNILRTDQEFSMRLQQAGVPPRGSQAEMIAKKMLHLGRDETVTQQHVQQVILSGLLVPTRQSDIGSCYATSYVIQMESYRMGLRQTLEDFLSIMQSGNLSRTETRAGGKVEVEHPIFADELLESTVFKHDHSLCRAREFTLAMLYTSDYIPKIAKNFNGGIDEPLNAHFCNLLQEKNAHENNPLIVEKIAQFRQGLFLSQCSLAYLPCRADPKPPRSLGARVIMDRTTGELIDSPEKYRALQISILEKAVKEFSAQFSEYQSQVEPVLEEMRAWIASPDYMNTIFQNDSSVLARLNPEKNYALSNELPWLLFEEGGKLNEILRIHSETLSLLHTDDVILETEKNKLIAVIDFVTELPDEIKRECQKNPEMKIPYGLPKHAISIMPASVFALLSKNPGKSTEQIVEAFIQECEVWADQELSQENKIKLLNRMMDTLEPSDFPHFGQSPSIQEAKTIKEFCAAIREESMKNGSDQQILSQMMSNLHDLIAEIYPKPSFFIGDTNWSGFGEFGYTADPLTGGIVLAKGKFGTEDVKKMPDEYQRGMLRFFVQQHLLTEFNIKAAKLGERQ